MYCIRYDIQLGGVLSWGGGGSLLIFLLLLASRATNASISAILVLRIRPILSCR